MAAFTSDIRQFKTPRDLAAYLDTLPIPDWPGDHPRGSTYHNTYRPLPSQWFGASTMRSMQAGYIAKGWTAGPHFYLCLGSPNPQNDGIWQMTPPSVPGIHAGDCNVRRFGVEVVGDFQSVPPPLPLQQLLIDTLTVLHQWAKLGPDLVAHRDCMPVRTCPGDAFYALKSTLQQQLAARLLHAGPYRVRHPQAIFEAPAPDARVALMDQAEVHTGDTVIIDEVKAGWAHLANGVGFVPVGILERLS